ncbi:hypothetical protein PIB30_047180 [Stylosanthes scabra]|uniref:Uncharacterized protein n=1 Tax=Stylosanthes scabra TaxID=79078 RepID=A0ABU6YF98_9FABA|nr:hypothetical protein [Stylosanthes scabra]
MSEEQRQQYLARWRASYREMIRRGKEIDVSNNTASTVTPLQDVTNTRRVVRLSAIRQIARTTSHSNFVQGHGRHDNELDQVADAMELVQVAATIELVQVTGVMAISLVSPFLYTRNIFNE